MNISNIVAVFPGGFPKGKSSHDDEYGHCQEKRRPSTYVGEKKSILEITFPPFYQKLVFKRRQFLALKGFLLNF